LTQQLNEEQLKVLVKDGRKSDIFDVDLFKLPCHRQATEWCVKLVTEASIRVADHVRREWIHSYSICIACCYADIQKEGTFSYIVSSRSHLTFPTELKL
jgi:hypothetical protein